MLKVFKSIIGLFLDFIILKKGSKLCGFVCLIPCSTSNFDTPMKSNFHFDANLNVGFSTATIFNVLFKDETLTSSRQCLWFAA
jgi:hypothetical protein